MGQALVDGGLLHPGLPRQGRERLPGGVHRERGKSLGGRPGSEVAVEVGRHPVLVRAARVQGREPPRGRRSGSQGVKVGTDAVGNIHPHFGPVAPAAGGLSPSVCPDLPGEGWRIVEVREVRTHQRKGNDEGGEGQAFPLVPWPCIHNPLHRLQAEVLLPGGKWFLHPDGERLAGNEDRVVVVVPFTGRVVYRGEFPDHTVGLPASLPFPRPLDHLPGPAVVAELPGAVQPLGELRHHPAGHLVHVQGVAPQPATERRERGPVSVPGPLGYLPGIHPPVGEGEQVQAERPFPLSPDMGHHRVHVHGIAQVPDGLPYLPDEAVHRVHQATVL